VFVVWFCERRKRRGEIYITHKIMASQKREMKVTQQEMIDAKLPVEYRDYCAHLLIPLNKCRREKLYLPWECVNERHEYEACQYDEFLRRKERYQEEVVKAKK